MCGSSEQQNQIAGQEQSFSSLLQANYAKNFGAQSQILQNLTNMFTPIAQAGPDQPGFGSQELAALNTQSGEGVGANYAKASTALNNELAAEGGGNQFLPTGARAALKANVATSAANEMSQERLGITRANYAQGRSNWAQATTGLNTLAGEFNPNQIASEGNQANSSAAGQAKEINQENNQWQSDLVGAVTGLAGGFLTGGLGNLDKTGSSSGGEQVGNFFSGGLQGLMG